MRANACEPGASFETWYTHLYPRLEASLVLGLGSREAAQEAAAESMARAFQHWERVSVMSSPDGWVFRVAINYGNRVVWRQNLERSLLLRHPRAELSEDNYPTEFAAIITDLAPRQRLALVLRHVAGLTEAEIGGVMGVGRGTVSATLRQAYQRLREGTTTNPAGGVQ
jgi:RNA polymerase sigma-70 factor (ECF subfamily)